jgi:hypothetical protein
MKIIVALFLITISLASCVNAKKTTDKQSQATENVATINHANNLHKYGLAFTIPTSWKAITTNLKITNLKGQVKVIEDDYQISNNSRVSLKYHPEAKGGEPLYDYYAKQPSSNLSKISINGLPVVKIMDVLKRDGKGHVLTKPMLRERYYLLTPNKSGTLEIIFDTTTDDQKAQKAFENFIASIKPLKA